MEQLLPFLSIAPASFIAVLLYVFLFKKKTEEQRYIPAPRSLDVLLSQCETTIEDGKHKVKTLHWAFDPNESHIHLQQRLGQEMKIVEDHLNKEV